MRYSSDHKAETHAQIVRTAANEFREHGINGVGVADLMKRAGRTHGGFYAHFESKTALLGEAINVAFDDTIERLKAAADLVAPDQRQQAIVDSYLDLRHRDRPDRGCAIATLGGEVSRLDPALRSGFEDRIQELLSLLNDNQSDPAARAESIRLLATMVGAMVMSRAVVSEKFSEEILTVARGTVKDASHLPRTSSPV